MAFPTSRRAPSGARRDSALPDWAEWRGDPSRRYTLGAEDEVMLLDPADWSLAQASDRVIETLSRDLVTCCSPETHAAVLELITGVHHDVAGVVAEVAALRERLAQELRQLGLAAASAGTHPAADWDETEVSHAPRYRVLEKTMRSLVRREPTMALHVHVGIPHQEDAVRLLNALRSVVPILLALSANSPFSDRCDSGFASVRRVLFQAFPRTGTPRTFANYRDYVDAVEGLVAPGAVPDASFLWWDMRLQPRFGSVELRVMDAQSAVADIGPLVALLQSFARLVLEGGYGPAPMSPEVVEENAFLAARDGMDARLIDPAERQLVPVRKLLRRLVADCRPHAEELGCAPELDGVGRLASSNGARRQRALLSSGAGFGGVVAALAARFATEDDIGRVRPRAVRRIPISAAPSFGATH
jgi:glutamate---cysteine ligase / carboxylate-amine ligase